ncbi:MAG: tetratricopeptide repeat protein [Candidatus Eisenbacteria bacterium]|uniref:Tetratricopeptide repeat protein n=1 Tax=Eiseniibacteriota bacterium TaxID=2212470 RepID=A0A948W5J6_UNCEI|nr:tetratricopeptide repeat protein [Candidatus Eisenbacteria bacterium]MBU1949300.1 tetratricopeptide repeat protein [Candidatus Eisenbacteria bacterium]MBU2690070.1 tetratricopeptide repeat protein [Candidatus Eisenbacteria bacterium]
MQSASYDLFLSYQSEDSAQAEHLYQRLQSAGFKVWFDRARLQAGFNWHAEIEEGVEASRIVLPILTPRWKNSEWTKFETYGAEVVIPLLCEGDWDDVATPPLKRWQNISIDAADPDPADWKKLLAAIRDHLRRPAPIKSERMAFLRYTVNPHFVGREREMNRIHEALHAEPTAALSQGKIHAIVAMGGIGKTTLARHYAERFWRLYTQIFWVDAREEESLRSGYAGIAKLLFPERENGTDEEKLAQRALVELNGSTERLLVLDNVEDEESIQRWIPKSGGCRTLITSRFTAWSPGIGTSRVYVLDPGPARELLLRRTGRYGREAQSESCDRLAETLGYLPLALEQAAAYVAEEGPDFGFEDYLELYREATQDCLAEGVLGSTEYPDSVVTTWKATLAKLSPQARTLLRFSSFLSPEPIPIELFIKNVERVRAHFSEFPLPAGSKPAKESSSDNFMIRNALKDLTRYAMVDNTGQSFLVHSLVQMVERLNAAGDRRSVWLGHLLEMVNAYGPVNAHYPITWDIWDGLRPHAEFLLNLIPEELKAETALSLNEELAKWYYGKGLYNKSLVWEGLKLELAKRLLPENDPRMGSYLINYGESLLRVRGRAEEAAEIFLKAVKIEENASGPESPSVADNLNYYAMALKDSGQEEKAENVYRRALAIYDKTSFPDSERLARVLTNLSSRLLDRGDCQGAEPLIKRAVDLLESGKISASFPYIHHMLAQLGIIYYETGRNAAAEPLLKRALEFCAGTLGPEHPEMVFPLETYAEFLGSEAAVDAAMEVYQRTLKVVEKNSGKESYTYARILNNIGLLLQSHNRLDEAEKPLIESLEIRRRVCGDDSAEFMRVMGNLGELYREMGRLDDAHQYLDPAVQYWDRADVEIKFEAGRLFHKLARLYRYEAKSKETEEMFRKALKILDQRPEHEWTREARREWYEISGEKPD